jgi:hypothetical protein
VEALDGHLAEMLLDAEVGQLVVGHLVVIVSVVTEDVLGNVEEFLLVFLEETNKGTADLRLTEELVFVLVVGNQAFEHSFSHFLGEGVVGEVELGFDRVDGDRGRSKVLFERVAVVQILIILRNVELISEVPEHGQKSPGPVEILFKGDPSVSIFVDLGEDLGEDEGFEPFKSGKLEGVPEDDDELVAVEAVLAGGVVATVARETQLSYKVDELLGEYFEGDDFEVMAEESGQDEGEFLLAEFAQNGEDECFQFGIGGVKGSALDIAVIESAEDGPDVDAKLASSFGALGNLFNFLDFSFASADVDFNDFEVFHVCDEIVVVFIDALEDEFTHVVGCDDTQKFVSIVDKFDELGEAHQSFRSSGHLASSVLPLEAHLTAMAFEEEVTKLFKIDGAAVVHVDSEDVLNDVVNFLLGFFLEDIHNNFFHRFDGDFLLGVHVLREYLVKSAPETVF